ncbi:MAG: ferritin-like domain-containing protein [Phycisphaeraceae bacterium]|nr:ferritin-like domain-containing protein [Phycisphaeraceae bacterium]MCW5769105.1 ferritin-like domain-containing protein [Phycisphaeraceae bacterium]
MPLTREQMIDLLNSDLASEYAAVIQYLTYAAKVTGPNRGELSEFLRDEIAGETEHARFLADKIVALGGVPVTVASPVPEVSDNKAMLEAVLAAEKAAVARYTERAAQAEAMGQKGLQVQLEDMVADETAHMEQVERILRGWRS